MLKLYDFPYSGHAHSVRMLLSILGLDYESVPVDLLAGEQRGDAYRAINPFGHVPALDDDGVVIRDSHAVLVYLARKHDDGVWLPEDPVGLARVHEWLATSAGEVARGPFAVRLATAFDLPLDYEAAAKATRDLFAVMDRHLEARAWLAADRATIADLSCYPYIAVAPEGGVPLDDTPALKAWVGRVEALPGFVAMPKLG